ncbi:MAG TPA: tetratricopeptide repeat protein [Blastocatellia bacterium]|nr:tetratricopeptide repeat protein [Blastocatellia bacterium]
MGYTLSAIALYGLGNSCFRQKEHDRAAEAYRQAIKLKPDFVEAYYDLAWRYRALNKPEMAIETYRQMINARPDPDVKENAYEQIAGVYKKLGKTAEVIEAQEQLVKVKLERKAIDAGLERDYGIAYEVSTLASLYRAAGREQEAIANYLRTQEIDPYSDLAFEGLLSAATLYKKTGKTSDAEKIYQDLMGKLDDVLKQKISSEREGAVYHIRGILYREMGRNKDALAAFQRAVRLRPDWVQPHSYLHRLYLAMGDQAAADKEFAIIKRLDEEEARSIKEATTVIKIK